MIANTPTATLSCRVCTVTNATYCKTKHNNQRNMLIVLCGNNSGAHSTVVCTVRAHQTLSGMYTMHTDNQRQFEFYQGQGLVACAHEMRGSCRVEGVENGAITISHTSVSRGLGLALLGDNLRGSHYSQRDREGVEYPLTALSSGQGLAESRRKLRGSMGRLQKFPLDGNIRQSIKVRNKLAVN